MNAMAATLSHFVDGSMAGYVLSSSSLSASRSVSNREFSAAVSTLGLLTRRRRPPAPPTPLLLLVDPLRRHDMITRPPPASGSANSRESWNPRDKLQL